MNKTATIAPAKPATEATPFDDVFSRSGLIKHTRSMIDRKQAELDDLETRFAPVLEALKKTRETITTLPGYSDAARTARQERDAQYEAHAFYQRDRNILVDAIYNLGKELRIFETHAIVGALARARSEGRTADVERFSAMLNEYREKPAIW